MNTNQASQRDPSTEQKILTAAREEFVDQGLGGARMAAIAEKADVNKALIHYYFRSKQNLYESVLADIMSHLWSTIQTRLEESPDTGDLRTVIHTAVTVYIHTLRENPLFPKLFIREMADGATHITPIFEKVFAPFGPLALSFMALIKKGMAAGTIRQCEPIHIMLNLLGMSAATFILQPMVSHIYPRLTGGQYTFDDAFYDTRITEITETIMNGITTGERNS